MVRRVKWWNQYREETPVIFGHYWRNFGTPDLAGVGKFGPDLFEGIEAHHWMGPRGNVYCVDFSVGMRASEHGGGHLAAVRFPEWTVVHDEHDSLENAIAIEHSNDEAGRDTMTMTYEFWESDKHGIIRQRSDEEGSCYPEVWRNGRWQDGTPYVMDAITGMGEDAYSCGEMAFELSPDEAKLQSKILGVNLFSENTDDCG